MTKNIDDGKHAMIFVFTDCVATMRTGSPESAESPKMELTPLTPATAVFKILGRLKYTPKRKRSDCSDVRVVTGGPYSIRYRTVSTRSVSPLTSTDAPYCILTVY